VARLGPRLAPQTGAAELGSRTVVVTALLLVVLPFAIVAAVGR
jgi:hypothetical protein